MASDAIHGDRDNIPQVNCSRENRVGRKSGGIPNRFPIREVDIVCISPAQGEVTTDDVNKYYELQTTRNEWVDQKVQKIANGQRVQLQSTPFSIMIKRAIVIRNRSMAWRSQISNWTSSRKGVDRGYQIRRKMSRSIVQVFLQSSRAKRGRRSLRLDRVGPQVSPRLGLKLRSAY